MPNDLDINALINQTLTGTNTPTIPTREDVDPLNMSEEELMQTISAMPGEAIPGVDPPATRNPIDDIYTSDNPYTNFAQNEIESFKDTPITAFNPLAEGKTELFGAGMDHHFYERYYEHPNFDELGFSPFRDNESLYNENTSAWNDAWRTLGEWGSLTWLGMKDAAGFGAQSDTEMAKQFERHMAIGSSTRGGATEFTNNLFLNSGYTFGILGELALEELGLALITGASLGTASGATAPVMAARGTRAFMKIKKGFDITKKMMRTLDNLKDVSKAKKFFLNTRNAAGRFINPASSTTAFIRAKRSGKLNSLEGAATTTLGFASFYRDVRNVRLAWGESGLEGGMVENQLSKELLAEFKAEHGRSPNEQEALELKETAIVAGKSAAWQNLPTIFFSNKIVFDNMFKAFSPIKRMTDDVIELGAKGKIRFTKGAAKDAYDKFEKGWKGLVQTAKNPKSYFRSGRNYFKANFAEGLQEIAQETIAGATMEYYKNRGSKASVFTGGYMDALGSNLQHMASMEGLEIFGSGFLMGGMVQGPQKLFTGAWGNRGRLTKEGRQEHLKIKAEREEHLNKTVNILNEFYNDPKKFLAPDLENMMEQHELAAAMNEALKSGDEKAFRDLKTTSQFSHVMTALDMGRYDSMVEQLEEELTLSDEDILAMPGVKSVDAFKATIGKAVTRAKDIQARYDVMQKKFPNPINPNQFKPGSPEYIEAIKAHAAWRSSQQLGIFMGHSFDRTLERMNNILKTAKESADLKNIPVSDFNKMFNFEDIQMELQQMETNMKLMDAEEGTLPKETKKLREDQKVAYDLLKAYGEAMADFVSVGTDTAEAPGSEMSQEGKDKFNAAADAFENYIKHLGQKHDQPIFEDTLAETFQEIVDYFQLKDDSKRLTSAVNTLSNPGFFKEQVERIAEINQYNYENKKEKIRKLLEAYRAAKADNELMNELFSAGMFFDPEEWKALKEDGIMPSTFYDVNNLDEIERGTPKYTTALDIVKKYMDITGIEIPEARSETTFSTKKRRKKVSDRRTYKDIAKQFGFDPEAESTEIPSTQVFETIIDSPYSTKREKSLAREYLKRAKPGDTVKFVKNHDSPGSYMYSEGGGTVTIDARYNSREYRLGTSPIEFVILHEETHRLTVEALATDEVYNDQITELREKALAFYASAEPDTTEGLVGRPDKPYYGLKDNFEFVAEAMSNPVFQKFLGSISHKHDPQNKTVWDSFVTSILKMMKTVFGKKNTTGTVLNAAIDIITGQIGPVDAPMTKMEYDSAKEKIETDRAVELQGLEEQARAAVSSESDTAGGTMTQTTPYGTPTGEVIQLPGKEEREWEGAPLSGEEWVSATGKEYTITGVDENMVYAEVDGKSKDIEKKQWLDSLNNKKIWPWEGEFGEVAEEEEIVVPQEEIDAVNAKFDKKLSALDKKYAESKAKETADDAEVTAKAGAPQVTRNTPIERMPDILVERLVESFINRNKSMEIVGEDPMLANFTEMSHLQIAKSKAFRNWVRDAAFAEPGKILNNFLGLSKKKATNKNQLKTEKMRRDLVALGGYTREDTNIMSFEEINNAIDLGLSKEEAEALYESKDKQAEANVKELIAEAKAEIVNVVALAENMDDFEEAKAFAQAHFAKHVRLMDDTFTGEWLDEVLQDKKKSLAFSVEAEKIRNGMTVQMKNGSLMKVVNADPKNKTILLENTKSKKEFRVYRDKVQEQIEFVWNKAMKDKDVAKAMAPEKLTPEDLSTSDESMKESDDIQDTAIEDTEEGKKAGETDEALEEQKKKMKDAIKKNCK